MRDAAEHTLDLTRLCFCRKSNIDLRLSFSCDNIRSRSATYHADIHGETRSRSIDRMQTLRLPGQFKYRAGAFLRFQTGMRRLALDLHREDASSLSAGFDSATWRWRFHHEGVTSVRRFRDLFQQRPT